MLNWLQQLQHARGKHVVFVGILEKVTDEFNRATGWQLQMEGGKTGRELPGIVDQVITYQFVVWRRHASALIRVHDTQSMDLPGKGPRRPA